MSSTELNNATIQINRYLSFSLILFGCTGNLFNCVVFLHRSFRSNPCAIYFLFSSIASIIALISGLTPRTLSAWNIIDDLTETNSILCKLRITVMFISRSIAPWLIVLATIDRYLISSMDVNRRYMSSLKQAYRWTTISCILLTLIVIEAVYCFNANLIDTPIKCYAKSDFCRIYNDLAQALITIFIPCIVMFYFGIRTLENLRQLRRLMPANPGSVIPANEIRNKRIENNLTRMVLIQIILLTIFNLPQAIVKFYLTHTFYHTKDRYQIVSENFFFSLLLLLSFIPYCASFYFFLFTSKLFRENFLNIGKKICRKIRCSE